MADDNSLQITSSDDPRPLSPGDEPHDEGTSEYDPTPDDEKLLEIARKRFDTCVEAESEIRQLGLDDQKFRSGNQWPDEIKTERDREGQACLTINKLPQYCHQIVNDWRQNQTAVGVNPVDDKADIEIAKILKGHIRHIEYRSTAEVAYTRALDNAVTRGYGYFRVITEYADEKSFDLEIRIKSIRDPDSVFLDPNYQELDGSDANFGFVVDNFDREEFRFLYPNATLSKMSDWTAIGTYAPDWFNQGNVRVAEYFTKEFSNATLYLLNNGQALLEEDLQKMLAQNGGQMPEHLEITDTRKTVITKIMWYKINGIEVLEREEWPGTYIPIIPVLGDEQIVDGKRILEGVIRHAKDPQRMYNYWESAKTDTIALAPRAPFIGAEGQFEGHEAQWKSANKRNHAYLEYKQTDVEGEKAAAPQRQAFEPPVQAFVGAEAQCTEDIKETTGIYDASLGNRSNEQSGLAIERRNNQAQVSNYHFVANLNLSIKHAGRIFIDLIPKVYTKKESIRILHDDGTPEMVLLNQIFTRNGKQINTDLSLGKYDVTVSSGPSFATRRQEAADSIIQFVKSFPQFGQVAGDLIVGNMDWEGAEEMASRLKKSLPPGLADSDQDSQTPIPPQVKNQMIQMQQMNQKLMQELQAATQELQYRNQERESKERIAFAQMQVDLQKKMAELNHQFGTTGFKEELSFLKHREELLNADSPMESIPGGGQGDQNSPAARPNLPQQTATPAPFNQQPTGGQPG